MKPDNTVSRIDTSGAAPGGLAKTDPEPAQSKTQVINARRALPLIPHVQADLKEADARGLLGPAKGRLADWLSKDVGSTGNYENDRLLGRLHSELNDLSTTQSQITAGARGAGGVALADRWRKTADAKNMSLAEILGAIEETQRYMTSFAKDPMGFDNPDKPKAGTKKTAAELIQQYLPNQVKP